MSTQSVKVSDTFTEVTHIVMPNDANPLQFLRGGRLMDWMDIASEITAQKLTHRVALTVSIDKVTFKRPARIGDIVTIRSQVTRTFGSSMEVFVEVWTENMVWQEGQKTVKQKVKSNDAYFTFVAIDDAGNPVQVPEVLPESPSDKDLFASALERRQQRLS